MHCIEFDKKTIGGESMFLDLFQVTEEFREKHPNYFDGKENKKEYKNLFYL